MSYWAKRMARSQAKITDKNIEEVEKQLVKYYTRTMKRVIADFEGTYEAVLRQIADGKEPTPALLYNLDKYWQLQGQLKKELEQLGAKEIALLSKNFEKEWFEIYNSIALPSGDAFNSISKEGVAQMINQIWCADGKSFSQRIWKNTELLTETLNEELVHCVVSGKNTDDLKKLLQQRFSVSYNNADMIARTEIAHIQTQAARQRYLDYGISEFEVWASKDERRCDVCGKLHQKRYSIYDVLPIPAHPRCRCTILPVVDVED